MAPQEFVNALQSQNQLPALVGEVARNKALAIALGKVTVVDTDGKPVDLTGFIAPEDEAALEEEVVEEAQEIADAAADEADKPAKKAPAKKPAAKKPAAKKADAEAPAAEEKPAAKKPAAKKAPAKKAPAKKADAE